MRKLWHKTGETISIHAPARGASEAGYAEAGEKNNFNSRPCERGFALAHLEQTGEVFQFTPLREGLPEKHGAKDMKKDFNSRPCERGFAVERKQKWITAISIHAPARGASAKNTNFLSVFCCFLFIKYIFTKLILSNPQINQYRPYFCAIFIAPISWDFMYGNYMRKVL